MGSQALLGGGVVAGTSFDFCGDEGVVVNGSRNLTASETRADFEALCRGDAEHGMGQLGLEFVEAWLTQADRDVSDHAGHSSSDAVMVIPELFNHLGHPCSGFFARTAGGSERVHSFTVDRLDEVQEFGVGRSGGMFTSRCEEMLVPY